MKNNKKPCPVCNKELDPRGFNTHVRSHEKSGSNGHSAPPKLKAIRKSKFRRLKPGLKLARRKMTWEELSQTMRPPILVRYDNLRKETTDVLKNLKIERDFLIRQLDSLTKAIGQLEGSEGVPTLEGLTTRQVTTEAVKA